MGQQICAIDERDVYDSQLAFLHFMSSAKFLATIALEFIETFPLRRMGHFVWRGNDCIIC